MMTVKRVFIAFLAAAAVAVIAPVLSVAAAPVVHEHAHFTSEPYDDEWCGIAGTSVDTVVAQYLEQEDGSSVETLNITSVFTATESGKTMVVRSTGARRASAPVDNGDGTYSLFFTNTGASPLFKLPNGPVIVLGVGLVEFRVTFDANDEFLSFEVVREEGNRSPGCDLIIAALT